MSKTQHTLFRDFLFLAALGFCALLVIVLPFLNPPGQKAVQGTPPPGNLVVLITWKPGPIDVDLWLSSPKDLKPVGYTNTTGELWDLLRDDLGTRRDSTPLNFENAYTRGIVPGEYVINVHCFGCEKHLPVEVLIEVSRKDKDGNVKKLLTTKVVLLRQDQELTALRFRLNNDLSLDRDSVNNIYKRLGG